MKIVSVIKDDIKFDVVLENVNGLVGIREEKPYTFTDSQLIFGITLNQARNLLENLKRLLDKINEL